MRKVSCLFTIMIYYSTIFSQSLSVNIVGYWKIKEPNSLSISEKDSNKQNSITRIIKNSFDLLIVTKKGNLYATSKSINIYDLSGTIHFADSTFTITKSFYTGVTTWRIITYKIIEINNNELKFKSISNKFIAAGGRPTVIDSIINSTEPIVVFTKYRLDNLKNKIIPSHIIGKCLENNEIKKENKSTNQFCFMKNGKGHWYNQEDIYWRTVFPGKIVIGKDNHYTVHILNEMTNNGMTFYSKFHCTKNELDEL